MGHANSIYEFTGRDGKQYKLNLRLEDVVFLGTTTISKPKRTGDFQMRDNDHERVKTFFEINFSHRCEDYWWRDCPPLEERWKGLRELYEMHGEAFELPLIRAKQYGAKNDIHFPRTAEGRSAFMNDLTPALCTKLVDVFDQQIPYDLNLK